MGPVRGPRKRLTLQPRWNRLGLARTATANVCPPLQIMAHGVDGLVQFCPVTCSVAGLAVGAFLWPEGLPLRPLCLSPYMVVEHGEWQR